MCDYCYPPRTHVHKFVVPTHCETCGMPAGGWKTSTTTTTNFVMPVAVFDPALLAEPPRKTPTLRIGVR